MFILECCVGEKRSARDRMDQKTSKLEELRVAKTELSSGNSSGQTFLRYSPGSVAFLTDRSVVEARISRLLQKEIAAQPLSPGARKGDSL